MVVRIGDVTTSPMKVKDLSLQQILTFAFCSMQYHLRYRHKLPWFPPSARSAYALVARETVREYFRLQLTAVDRRMFAKSTVAVMEEGMGLAMQTFPHDVAYLQRNRTELQFSLAFVRSQFEFPRDRMIGFDIPYETVLSYGDKRVKVKGSLDAAFFRNVDTAFEQAVCVSIVSIHDPMEDLGRYGGVRRGFATYVLRKGVRLESGTSIQHKFLPVLRKVNAPTKVLWMDDLPNLESVKRKDATSFRQTSIQVARGIDAGFAIPAMAQDRCRHCPYDEVCTQSLATRKPTQGERDAVVSASKASPFRTWPMGEVK